MLEKRETRQMVLVLMPLGPSRRQIQIQFPVISQRGILLKHVAPFLKVFPFNPETRVNPLTMTHKVLDQPLVTFQLLALLLFHQCARWSSTPGPLHMLSLLLLGMLLHDSRPHFL